MHFQDQSGIEAREGEHSSQTAKCLTARVLQSDFGRYSRLVSALWLFRSLNAQIENALRLMETASTDPAAIPLTPQDLTKREYFGREIPQDGKLFWSLPAREIVNFVRACDYFPFPSPWRHPQTILETMSGEKEIGVVKARLTGERCDRSPGTVGEVVGSGVKVACGD